MKFLFPFPVLLAWLLACCAPKATLVDEADQPTTPVAGPSEPEEPSEPDLPPSFVPNDGLLDPAGLGSMPTASDMRPTVGPADEEASSLIINPSNPDPAASE